MKLDCRISHIILNAGGDANVGNGYGSAGWFAALHNTVREKPTKVTPREALDWCVKRGGQGLHLHNPAGQLPPLKDTDIEMFFDQKTRTDQRALTLDPADPQFGAVQNRVNWLELIRAAAAFPYKISSYIGAPHRYRRIGRESQAAWLARALEEIYLWLIISDVIGLDNTLGDRPEQDEWFVGEHGVVADLIHAIEWQWQKVVGHEPTNYVSSHWLARKPKFVSDDFLNTMESINWRPRKIDHEPLQKPGALGEPVYLLCKAGWSLATTPQAKADYLNGLQQRYPEFNLMVYAGNFPAEFLEL